MKVQPAGFLSTSLPLATDTIDQYDSGRYHSIWLPDHMVTFTPDSLWHPDFTEAALSSPSPHRCLDGMAVAAAAAALTRNVELATCVVDTVRRHPSMLAQSALTISHLSKGRFILGLGSGELENIVPYGFDFAKPVSRFEESLKLIRLLWESESPVDFQGIFYRLEHARMDAEPFDGKYPPIWTGASGPRMLALTGQYADGWWPAGACTPEDYAAKLKVILDAGEAAGRDMSHFVPAFSQICLIGDEGEIEEMLEKPLVKTMLLIFPAHELRQFGYEHPMGPDWQGTQDFDPARLSRERMIQFLADVDTRALRDIFLVGTPKQVAVKFKAMADAGMRVFRVVDYGRAAGAQFAATSAQKVRAVEDEVLCLCQ